MLWSSHFTKKNYLEIFLILLLLHKWHADLHGFANFCKLPIAHTFKVKQSKICQSW